MKLDAHNTRDQQKRMFAMLDDIAEQVPWKVNGRPESLTRYDWKDIFTAGLTKELRVATAHDGHGFVMLGERTRDFGKRRMSDLIDLMVVFGEQHNVKWRDEAKEPAARNTGAQK